MRDIWGKRFNAQVCKPTARDGKIFYPKISRGSGMFSFKKASMQKLCKWKACKTFPSLEREGDRRTSVESRMHYVNQKE